MMTRMAPGLSGGVGVSNYLAIFSWQKQSDIYSGYLS
jgi:hypothetical protein